MRSNYNDTLRALGLPELPDCEQCGLQVRRNMESPVHVVRDNDGTTDVHTLCGVACAQAWLAEHKKA